MNLVYEAIVNHRIADFLKKLIESLHLVHADWATIISKVNQKSFVTFRIANKARELSLFPPS